MANRPTLKLPVDKIEPNKYNPNIMPENLYDSLKQSVKEKEYDPIIVAPKDVFYGDSQLPRDEYVIIDGEHRWKAAKELKQKNIVAEIRDTGEKEARAVSYQRNRERGTIDPIKEAQLFKLELDEGMMQKEVAEKYHVSASQVSERLRLLQLDEQTVKAYQKPKEYVLEKKVKEYAEDLKEFEDLKKEYQEDYVIDEEQLKVWEEENKPEEPTPEKVEPAGELTPSHLEILASIEDEEYRASLRDDILEQGLSVRRTEEIATRIKNEIEKKKELAQIVAKAKRPVCPKCGGEPSEYSTYNKDSIRCSDCWNWWDSSISEEEVQQKKEKEESDIAKELRESRAQAIKKARANPSYVRRLEHPSEIREKIENWLTYILLTKLSRVKELEFSGYVSNGEDKYARIVYESSNDGYLNITLYEPKEGVEEQTWWNRTKIDDFSIRLDEKDYKRTDHKTRIDINHEVSPVGRSLVHNFIDDILVTPEKAQWPWHNKEDITGALESGAEEEDIDEEEEEELEADIVDFDVETVNLDGYKNIITAFTESKNDKSEVTVEDIDDSGELRSLLIAAVIDMDLENEILVQVLDGKVILEKVGE